MEAVQLITISGTDVSFASYEGNATLEVLELLEENQLVNSFTNKLSQINSQQGVQPVLSSDEDSFSSFNNEVIFFVSRIFLGLIYYFSTDRLDFKYSCWCCTYYSSV